MSSIPVILKALLNARTTDLKESQVPQRGRRLLRAVKVGVRIRNLEALG